MGDAAKFVENTVKDTVRAVAAPVEATLDLAKGDTKSAGERFVKAAGTVANAATGGTAQVLASAPAQEQIRRTGWNDAAGFNAAIDQARTSGTVSNQYRDEFLRFTSQAAVIGAGSYAYSNPVIPTGVSEAPFVSGKEIFAGISMPGLPSATEAALGYSLFKGGKPADAFEKLTGIALPDWLKDIIPSDSSDPTEFAPWKNDTQSRSSSFTGAQGENPTMKILMYGAGAVILILILKKVVKK